MRRPAAGFSLVELLVTVLFLGLLVTGMAQLCLACLRHWQRVGERLAAQRALRRAMVRLTGDGLLMGCRLPPPGPGPPAPAAPPVAGEWSFILDAPGPVPAALAEPREPGAGSLPLRCPARVELAAGDRLGLLDGPLEWVEALEPVPLPARTAVPVPVGPLRFPHPAGARVQLVRPLRVVRYAVVPLARSPAEPARPCLVRFEAPLGPDRSLPPWESLLGRRPGPRGGSEVVAERVTGFRVDFPLEPGPQGAGPLPGLVRITLEAGAGPTACGLTVQLAPRHAGLDGGGR